jgi:two-component system capsular synthesis sensor histidine kinase RcsC
MGLKTMLRILYVEDNPDSIQPVKRIANHEGYELYTADTVKAGISIMQNHSPTLVLLDMQLPDGTAVDFTRQVREQGSTCPIVVITGYTIQKERDACFAAGCTDFLIKPVEVHTFIELFRHYNNQDRTT